MKKFIETIKNIWSIEELRQRILLTLGLVLIYRVGTYITLPGIDPTALDNFQSASSSGLLGLVNIFAGGAFSNASIFALGIMPYISASIAIQLFAIVIPYFQKLQKEGESGRSTLNQYTRLLTILVTGVQGGAYTMFLNSSVPNAIVPSLSPTLFWLSTMFVLTAGTLFVMWIGERITDKGIGNGISIIIMVGILARLPESLLQEFTSRETSGGVILFLLELVFLFAVILACILLVQGTRRIPVNYAKRNVVQGGRMMQTGGARQYLPLKINASGVMPIIFAQAIMFLPATVAQFANAGQNSWFMVNFNNPKAAAYNITYMFLIIIFTYFYTAIIINPKQISDDLKKNNGFIPGVKPGQKTEEFIDSVISRITLPGAIFLGFVAIMPAFAMGLGVNDTFAYFFGGSSMLIMVGVILDTLQTIETHLMNRHYDGLTSKGRIKGRQGYAQASM